MPTNTSTTINAPPDYLQNAGNMMLGYTNNLMNQPYQGYAGQMAAPMSAGQNQYAQMAQQMAAQGQPQVLTDANRANSAIMGGSLYGQSPGMTQTNPYAGMNNPYMGQVINNTMGDVSRGYQTSVAPQTDAAANMQNAFGGSGWMQSVNNNQDTLAKNLGSISSSMRMQDFTNQQGLAEAQLNRSQGAFADASGKQLQAIQTAPNLANAGYGIQQGNLANIANVGNMQQANSQAGLNEQQSRIAEQQQYPYNQLKMMQGTVGSLGGLGGGQTTTSQDVAGPNPWATAAGVGLTGLGIYNAGRQGGLWGNAGSGGAQQAGDAAGDYANDYYSTYGGGDVGSGASGFPISDTDYSSFGTGASGVSSTGQTAAGTLNTGAGLAGQAMGYYGALNSVGNIASGKGGIGDYYNAGKTAYNLYNTYQAGQAASAAGSGASGFPLTAGAGAGGGGGAGGGAGGAATAGGGASGFGAAGTASAAWPAVALAPLAIANLSQSNERARMIAGGANTESELRNAGVTAADLADAIKVTKGGMGSQPNPNYQPYNGSQAYTMQQLPDTRGFDRDKLAALQKKYPALAAHSLDDFIKDMTGNFWLHPGSYASAMSASSQPDMSGHTWNPRTGVYETKKAA